MWSVRLAASGSRGRIASTERRNLIVSNVPLSLNAQILGEPGPALVVLHGLFGFHTNWRSFGRKLSGQCQVHLLDLRNHGDSPHSDTMDYPGMAADVLAYLDHHALPTRFCWDTAWAARWRCPLPSKIQNACGC